MGDVEEGIAAESGPLTDPLIGRVVGRSWRVRRKLGEGGMGAVYLAEHVDLPQTLSAVKVLHSDVGVDPAQARELVERFIQEAKAASAVGSHRVVQIFDVGQFDDGTRYLIMEFIQGRSLAQALAESGPLPLSSALLVSARAADTLRLAHERGIIHRDVKPANLMLASEGRDPAVKLVDFGVARATGQNKLVHTTEHKVIGTPGYMAPEAVIGATVDGRADVYSLAATLYESLSGQLPTGGDNYTAMMMNTITQPVRPVSTLRPPQLDPVPPFVDALLAAGLEKDPALRPQMADFQELLVAATDQLAALRSGGRANLGSVLRSVTPIHSQRPTLSATAGEVSALVARYGALGPQAAGGEAPSSDGAPRGAGSSGHFGDGAGGGTGATPVPIPATKNRDLAASPKGGLPSPGDAPPGPAASAAGAPSRPASSAGTRIALIVGGVAAVLAGLALSLLHPWSKAPAALPVAAPDVASRRSVPEAPPRDPAGVGTAPAPKADPPVVPAAPDPAASPVPTREASPDTHARSDEDHHASPPTEKKSAQPRPHRQHAAPPAGTVGDVKGYE